MLCERRRRRAWLLLAWLPTGCYFGVDPGLSGTTDGGDLGSADGPESGGTADTGGDSEGGSTGADSVVCDDVAFSPMERLSRGDYRRSAQQLFPGVVLPDVLLPDDEDGAGVFTSNVMAMVDTGAIRRYSVAAGEIAAAVVEQLPVVLPCYSPDGSTDECLHDYVESLSARAYRRPLSAEQTDELSQFLVDSRAEFGDATAIELGVASVLQSPHFLYHVEVGDQAGPVSKLDGYEVASRLSYFLWGTMPDQQVFEAAASGELDTADGIASHAQRMLDDPRARDAVAAFHARLLGVDKLGEFTPDPAVYPEFDEGLRTEMDEEFTRFVQWQVFENDAKLADLLTSSQTFVGPGLAELYGVDPLALDPDDPWAEPVDLDPSERAGVLTQSAFLAAHSDALRGSPLLRGIAIREQLLCTLLPPPPPDIPDPPVIDPDTTSVREVNDQHLREGCMTCHVFINPIGFAFIGYDSIGGRLQFDGSEPVDESGELTATDVNGEFVGAPALAEKLAESEDVMDCFTANWMRYALARDVATAGADACSVEQLQDEFSASGGDIKQLLLGIASTHAFSHRRLDKDDQ